MMLEPLTADKLIQQINLSKYIPGKADHNDMSTKCRAVLAAQIEETPNRVRQVETALEFIKALWRKYDCLEVATRYENYVKVEEALFGLERQEDAGKRYRDHFVHMFNCYVFGLRVISCVLAQTEDHDAKRIFKVDDESVEEIGLPFGDYPFDKRLFYIWTLIATFHDIAIPFEHLEGLGEGIGKFLEGFGWIFGPPEVTICSFDSSQLHYYFNLIGATYGGKLEIVDKGRKYRKVCRSRHYIAKLLGREFDHGRHGVLSGFLMWKTIEEIWLTGRSAKHAFTNSDQFNSYAEYVLEQDIARAALAISLHAIDDKDDKCMVYPMRFDHYPLAFLLILADELQEYLRWEGTTPEKEVNFSYHPLLKVTLDAPKKAVEVDVSFSLDKNSERATIDRAQRSECSQNSREPGKNSRANSSISTLDQAAVYVGDSMKKTLERKLKLGDNFRVRLSILQDWDTDKLLYGEDLAS